MANIDITGTAYVISDISQPVQLRSLELVSSDVIEHTIRTELSQIQEVRGIHLMLEDDVIEVWTMLTHADYAIRRKVYEAELRIREHLPGFFFNFATSAMSDSPSLQASGHQRIFSR